MTIQATPEQQIQLLQIAVNNLEQRLDALEKAAPKSAGAEFPRIEVDETLPPGTIYLKGKDKAHSAVLTGIKEPTGAEFAPGLLKLTHFTAGTNVDESATPAVIIAHKLRNKTAFMSFINSPGDELNGLFNRAELLRLRDNINIVLARMEDGEK